MSIHHLHRYNENELRSILDKLPSMVALIGPDRRYRIINRAYSRYFAVDEGDLSGRQASEIMPRAQYAMLERYLDETLASGSMRMTVTTGCCRSSCCRIVCTMANRTAR